MVSLSKGQGISLSKAAPGLSVVAMGLGWDVAKRGGLLGSMFGGGGGSIDLDASCLMFDAAGGLIDTIWFRQLQSKDGSVLHSGDNRTGDGDGDDEVINVRLGSVPAAVQTLMFTVNSFTGQDFSKIANATCRAVDTATGKELARVNLSETGKHTALVMAKLVRKDGGWDFVAVGTPGYGATFKDLMPIITAAL
ncbi:TerD family protein [Sandarakinorhabdus sp.]|uniref:TerD family protein n=1 Tax=Sandarakinorhabdus sp. TaxID=1916663 RepID=UPI003340B9B5